MPLAMKDGESKEVSWDEAVEVIVDKLKSIREKNGADAISGRSSARSSNEANYLFQKMLRSLGTNNVDHCARV